jgi:amino acid transporter
MISATVIIPACGVSGGVILVGPPVYFAMARDGIFFAKVGRGHSIGV